MNLIKPTKDGFNLFYPKELIAKIFSTSIEKVEKKLKVTKVILGKKGLRLKCQIITKEKRE